MGHWYRLLKMSIFLGMWLPVFSLAGSGDLFYTSPFSKTAVGGYDVVSYFNADAQRQGPILGDRNYETEYGGVMWRFATKENLALFLSNPERYLPQYGGYCAWAVSRGYPAKGDPHHWSLEDGKRYLNYNADVKKNWARDIPGNIEKGNANWTGDLE
jgi:YHS domain-containing protein